jgi:hypothetical protein
MKDISGLTPRVEIFGDVKLVLMEQPVVEIWNNQ